MRGTGKGVRALKPLLSGFTEADAAASDAGVLLAALGEKLTPETLDAMSPWRFAAPLAPDAAAKREGRSIDFDALLEFCRAAMDGAGDHVIIEGIGGAMVPLDDRHTVRDWMAALAVPAILVTGSYLGAISHTLTTLGAMESGGVPPAAIVVSESQDPALDLGEMAATLARFAPAQPIICLARGAPTEPAMAELAAI